MHVLVVLFIILLMAFGLPRVLKAMDQEEGLSIGQYEGEFTLQYFNYKEKILTYFESKELQGGGPTWAALVRAALEMEASPHLHDIQFDEEGDMLFLFSLHEQPLLAVKVIIERLNSDLTFREKCIKHAASAGYLE